MRQKFYVTFGVQYAHQPHKFLENVDPDGYLEVFADDETDAREALRQFINNEYAFIYNKAHVLSNRSKWDCYFPAGPIGRWTVIRSEENPEPLILATSPDYPLRFKKKGENETERS